MLGVKSEKSFLNCKTYILELDLCKRIFFICNHKFVWFDAEFDGIHMLLNIEKNIFNDAIYSLFCYPLQLYAIKLTNYLSKF